jgi:8-oxo-dGTP pyrophosphatase MutT (NUDIX family)
MNPRKQQEAREETGILVDVTGLIGVYSDPQHVIAFADGEVRQEFSLCFRARPVQGDLRTSSESKEVLWVEPARLDDLNIHPSIKLRIQHGFEHRAKPFYA